MRIFSRYDLERADRERESNFRVAEDASLSSLREQPSPFPSFPPHGFTSSSSTYFTDCNSGGEGEGEGEGEEGRKKKKRVRSRGRRVAPWFTMEKVDYTALKAATLLPSRPLTHPLSLLFELFHPPRSPSARSFVEGNPRGCRRPRSYRGAIGFRFVDRLTC